jgi:hypothetical protein
MCCFQCEPCLEKSVRCGGVGNKERGSQERGTRKSRNGRRTFFVGCGGLDRQVSASRVSRLFGVRTGLQSPPTNPPTNSRFLRFGNGRSKCCKRKNPGKSGVFASIRNAKGSLNELRNRRFQVRPLTDAVQQPPRFITGSRWLFFCACPSCLPTSSRPMALKFSGTLQTDC